MEFDEQGESHLPRPWKSFRHSYASQRGAFGRAHPRRLLADLHERRQDFAKHPAGQSAEAGCFQHTLSAPVSEYTPQGWGRFRLKTKMRGTAHFGKQKECRLYAFWSEVIY